MVARTTAQVSIFIVHPPQLVASSISNDNYPKSRRTENSAPRHEPSETSVSGVHLFSFAKPVRHVQSKPCYASYHGRKRHRTETCR
jgi:hypothetical protein